MTTSLATFRDLRAALRRAVDADSAICAAGGDAAAMAAACQDFDAAVDEAMGAFEALDGDGTLARIEQGLLGATARLPDGAQTSSSAA